MPKKLDETFEAFLDQYTEATKDKYRAAVAASVKTIGNELLKLDPAATQQQVVDAVYFHLYKDWGSKFSKKQKATIRKNVAETYRHYRRDKSVFPAGAVVPDGVFGVEDVRTMAYYNRSDGLYLGKFITDEDTRKKISNHIVDEYVKGDTPIGNDRDALDNFKKKFGNVLDGEDWKIRRVIDTSLNRLRNQASLSFMAQANVEQYEIVGISDNRQSQFCSNINGRVFQVAQTRSDMESLSNSDPANVAAVSPFGTSIIKAGDIPGTTDEALQQMGLGIPPYHGHCRTTIVAVL